MEEVRVNQSVMAWGVVFGVVVTKVGASRGPVNIEVALVGAIPDTAEAHVNCFLTFLLDGVIGKTNCCGVIDLHGSRGLRMSKFFKCRTDW